MRRLVVLLAFVALAWPATASAKEGAMFSPQLLTLSSGKATRVRLYVWPVIRGEREVPAVGSIPVVRLRLVSGRRVLRFRGSPLRGARPLYSARDRCIRGCGPLYSVVWIKLPTTAAWEWEVLVRAGGRVYPDLVDLPASPITQASAPPGIAPRRGPSKHVASGSAWPLVLAGLLLAAAASAFAFNRVRRVGRELSARGV